jgi:hypothetical protein
MTEIHVCDLQGIYNGLNGTGGLAGWRCCSGCSPLRLQADFFQGLFILDGVITVPIALLGYLVMPDLPSTTKPSMFYTQEQLDIAQKRMDSVGRRPPAKFTKEKVQVAC